MPKTFWNGEVSLPLYPNGLMTLLTPERMIVNQEWYAQRHRKRDCSQTMQGDADDAVEAF